MKGDPKSIPQLTRFYQYAEHDQRITVNHISLYLALFQQWNLNGCENPVSISRRKILRAAKIGRSTYHICMRELNAFGYIKYIPSYHPKLGSQVYVDIFPFNPLAGGAGTKEP